jgi:hypothetical protein
MSSETMTLLSLGGAFVLVALASIGLGSLARTARVLFSPVPPKRDVPSSAEAHALAAWEDEGGARAGR